jgi:hypothetical protein
MKYSLLILLTSFLIGNVDKSRRNPRSEESVLRRDCFKGYIRDIRPVYNSSTVTYINISLTNIQVMHLVLNKTTLK